ncbi:NAC domain-containing protein 90 [Camellia lanceoleosa]|uniref:NAC domain-containing protein 90 n=1 Tax=Camellia lanceoleosa TaxID=1840588 RepID=A0ACC0HMN2_9ERIC|nr:NAC domain-containing protein 90 [Camellia lanceoleosa]
MNKKIFAVTKKKKKGQVNLQELASKEFAGKLCREDVEQWFFFIPREENEACEGRQSRFTTPGYWKAIGCPGYVYSARNQVIGIKRTMVFCMGIAPVGRKTKWKMNECRAIESSSVTTIPQVRQEFRLCRVLSSGSDKRCDC